MSSNPAPDTAAPPKLALIISTIFYPDPQVGAIRMSQWCRHLPEFGWNAHVMCRYYGLEATAEELRDQFGPAFSMEYLDRPVEVDATKRSYWLFRKLRALKRRIGRSSLATLAVPDLSIRFWQAQREQVLKRVLELKPDVIITTSPPHSVHDLGMWLAAETSIPWLADFRDPYMLDSRFKPRGLGKLRWGAHIAFKNAIYTRAWQITHAIPNQHRWSRLHFKHHRGRMQDLRNAFPESLVNYAAEPRTSAKNVRVAGTIPEQEQIALAKAVALVAQHMPDVRLTLIGRIPAVAEDLKSILGDRLTLTGYLPHCEAVKLAATSSLLVNYLDEARSASRLLSTKLFEYLASGNPIICVNPSHADKVILGGEDGVEVMHMPSVEVLAGAISAALSGQSSRPLEQVAEFRTKNTWRERVRVLVGKLDRLVAFPPSVAPNQSAGSQPKASVVMPTRNRRLTLKRAILSAMSQSVPVEIIVMDDGSTDGTADMLRTEFPSVRYYSLGTGKGPCFQRNRGIELARSEFVFPIDDDSVFSTPYVVEQTLTEFDDPAIGAIGIPFVNPRLDWTPMQLAPAASKCLAIHAFVGAAHALRRSVFLGLSGYREHFFYMGEEGDLCARMLAAGYITRMGKADVIHHMESPARSRLKADLCGRKNDVLFAWHNAPARYLPLHILATTLNGIRTGIRQRNVLRMLRGLVMGYQGCLEQWHERKPIPLDIYQLLRRLKKRGPTELAELRSVLPAPMPFPVSQPNSTHE